MRDTTDEVDPREMNPLGMKKRSQSDSSHDHFQGKTALQHIIETQADGISVSSEIHGAETPGPMFAYLDAMRDSALIFALLATLFLFLHFSRGQECILALSGTIAYALLRGIRAIHLGYFRLERLHRVAYEEKREIETNREQEREELKELYKLKGFQGKLLDDVVTVLMADNDRLLRVMLQEEMGFRLSENEHPIKEGIYAAAAPLLIAPLLFSAFFFSYPLGVVVTVAVVMGSWWYCAHMEKNRALHATIWGGAGALFIIATFYTLLKAFIQ